MFYFLSCWENPRLQKTKARKARKTYGYNRKSIWQKAGMC